MFEPQATCQKFKLINHLREKLSPRRRRGKGNEKI
jgi:hypothetical protein